MTEAEKLQNHLQGMRTAPLPLTHGQSVQHAIKLRRRHYTYPAIAKVMGDYHGAHHSASWWRKQCIKHGGPVFYPALAGRLP